MSEIIEKIKQELLIRCENQKKKMDITLDIDKAYNKILDLQKMLKENFKPFFLEFNICSII